MTPPAHTAKVGNYVPLTAKPGLSSALEAFAHQGYLATLKEPSTLQWFALKYKVKLVTRDLTPQALSDEEYLVFDTFADSAAREAHVKASAAAAPVLYGLLADGKGREIIPTEILASQIVRPVGAEGPTQGLKAGMCVLFYPKEGKEEQLTQHITDIGKTVLETGQERVWFGFKFGAPGSFTVGIFSLFETEDAANARLETDVVKNLRDKNVTDELFARPPDMVKLEVLAAKF